MKKWQVVLLIVVLSVSVLGVSGVLIYRYYFVPRFVEPIVDEIGEYVNSEEVLDELYEEALRLHGEGDMDDNIYSSFIRAYKQHKRNNVDSAKEILAEYQAEDTLDRTNNAKSTKYASYKVGVETIQVNETESNGKSEVNYSDERTSDRIKAEDVVQAEKIIEKAENSEPTQTPDDVRSAFDKLRANMSSQEFSTFTQIMRKLDINTLKQNIFDKQSLKAYLHQQLTDEEYKNCVNLGYKYVYLFIEN